MFDFGFQSLHCFFHARVSQIVQVSENLVGVLFFCAVWSLGNTDRSNLQWLDIHNYFNIYPGHGLFSEFLFINI